MRGGKVTIETANGVVLSATPNADGTLGPWSASNLHTQSGGNIENQLTNDDGTTTTHYADGSVVTSGGPAGGSQTWGPDGTYTNATPDGQVTTNHPDGSVDVRSPDGTVVTNLPDGSQTTHSPDGTVVQNNPDGSTITHNPDGTVDGTQADGTKFHQSTDGTSTSSGSDGSQTVVNSDGTTTITAPDGSTQTHWPDGSSESVNADGSKTIQQPDGTTFIHTTDGTVITQNPDGSDETRFADGTVSQTNPQGVETTWDPNGDVTTVYPNGAIVTHNADGSIDASAPDGTQVGDPNALLHNLDEQSGYMSNTHPEVFQAVQDLQRQVAANGGAWTPAELATLIAIQNAANQGADQRHEQIVKDQTDFANAGMTTMVNRLQNEQQLERDHAATQALIDKQEQYIRNHLDDFPVSKWGAVQDTLDRINSHSPNADDLNRLRVISHSMFGDSLTDGAAGKHLDDAIRLVNAPPPGPPPGTDLPSLVGAQQDFLSNHLYLLPPAQQDVIRHLIDRSYAQPTLADLATLQRASHAVFNTMQGGSEAAGAQAQIDSLNAEARMVTVQRINTAAQGVGLAIAAPIMITGAAGLVGAGGVVGGILAPVTIPGAAAAMGSVGAANFLAQGLTGAINGYYEPGQAGGIHGAVFGAAQATLPINTITAVMHGEGAVKIGLSVVQDTGNVLGAISAGHQVEGWVNQANQPGGALNRLFGEPAPPMTPDDAKFLAQRAEAGRNISDLRDAQLRSFDDPNFQRASQNLANAEGRLALNSADAAAQAEVKAARAVLDANANQQQLENATRKMLDDYQSRNLIKQMPPELQQAYIDQVKGINARVDDRFVQSLNDAGYLRGGKPFTQADLVDLRNATSTNAPMDRDLALNQMRERDLANFIKNPPPSADPDQLQRLTDRLQQIRSESALTLNGKPISPADWQVDAQTRYGKDFTAVTGKDSDLALQQVTVSTHVEAYPDLNVLKNDPANHPFDPGHAEATGGVTTAKAVDNAEKFHDQPWNAQQETARGTAKDIDTKLGPLLQAKGADPVAIQQAQDAANFLRDVGNGRYPPSQADALARSHFGTDINGLNTRVGAAITTATRFDTHVTSTADQFEKGIRGTVKLINADVKLNKLEGVQQATDKRDQGM